MSGLAIRAKESDQISQILPIPTSATGPGAACGNQRGEPRISGGRGHPHAVDDVGRQFCGRREHKRRCKNHHHRENNGEHHRHRHRRRARLSVLPAQRWLRAPPERPRFSKVCVPSIAFADSFMHVRAGLDRPRSISRSCRSKVTKARHFAGFTTSRYWVGPKSDPVASQKSIPSIRPHSFPCRWGRRNSAAIDKRRDRPIPAFQMVFRFFRSKMVISKCMTEYKPPSFSFRVSELSKSKCSRMI